MTSIDETLQNFTYYTEIIDSINENINKLSDETHVLEFNSKNFLLLEIGMTLEYKKLEIVLTSGQSFKISINLMHSILDLKLFICNLIIDDLAYLDVIDINLSINSIPLIDEQIIKDLDNFINLTIIIRDTSVVSNCNCMCTIHTEQCNHSWKFKYIGEYCIHGQWVSPPAGIIIPTIFYNETTKYFEIPVKCPSILENSFTQLTWYYFRNRFTKLINAYNSSDFHTMSKELINIYKKRFREENQYDDIYQQNIFSLNLDISNNYKFTYRDFKSYLAFGLDKIIILD